MSSETLDKPRTGLTPFTLLYGEELPLDDHVESEWFFSADTQGFTGYSAVAQDKIILTNSSLDPGEGDLMSRFG